MEAFFAFAYSFVALINVVSYFPQILSLIRAKSRSVNVSVASWLMWAFSYILSVGYGIFCLEDMRFVVVSAISLVMVLSVTVLLVHNIYIRFRPPEETKALVNKVHPKTLYLQVLTGMNARRLRRQTRDHSDRF